MQEMSESRVTKPKVLPGAPTKPMRQQIDEMNSYITRMHSSIDSLVTEFGKSNSFIQQNTAHIAELSDNLKNNTQILNSIQRRMCQAASALDKHCIIKPSETMYVAEMPSALDAYTPQLEGLHVDAWGDGLRRWRRRMPSMPSWGGRRQRVAPQQESRDMYEENGREALPYDTRQAPPREDYSGDYSDDPRRPVQMAVEELRELANRLEQMMETNGGEGEMGGGEFRG